MSRSVPPRMARDDDILPGRSNEDFELRGEEEEAPRLNGGQNDPSNVSDPIWNKVLSQSRKMTEGEQNRDEFSSADSPRMAREDNDLPGRSKQDFEPRGDEEEAPRLRGVRSDPSFVSDPIVEFVRS